MNVERYLILIKQEDKTADVIRYEYQSGLVNVILRHRIKYIRMIETILSFIKTQRKLI